MSNVGFRTERIKWALVMFFFLWFVSGVCLGLQCAVIEFARNVLGWSGAHSTECVPDTPHPVVSFYNSVKCIILSGKESFQIEILKQSTLVLC